MQLKKFIFSLTAMLALLIGVQQPLSAAKKTTKKNRSEKHHKHSFSSSSSRHHKKKKCCYHDRIECKLNNVLKAEKELINNLIGCDVLICELPYTISKPGTYRITCDLAFNPATPNQTAITIAASDVVLDLGTNRIYQVSGNLQPATGVFVSPNTTNITITGETTGKRGTIQGFEGWGINCPGPNDFLGGNIKIENIIVEECGSDARVDGVFYVDGGIQVGTFTFGIPPVKPISEVLVSNVLALKNKNIGIGLYVTDTVIVQDCVVDGTYSEAPTYLLIGLDIENPVQDADPMPYTKNAQILRTSVTNTHCHTIASYDPNIVALGVWGTNAIGVYNLNVIDSDFSRTSGGALNNNANQEAGPFVVYSLNFVQGPIVNCTFDNCTFSDAIGDRWTYLVQGFHTSANTFFPEGMGATMGHVYKNCTSIGNIGYYLVNNFSFLYTQDLTIDNCIALGNTLLAGGEQSVYDALTNLLSMGNYGFWIVGGSGITGGDNQTQNDRGQAKQVVVKDCTAQGFTSEVGQVAGFLYGGGPFFKFQTSPTYSAGTASQSGSTVTGVGTAWTTVVPSLVGGVITFANGVQAIISSVDSDTQLTVSPSQVVANQAYTIQYVPTAEINLKDISFINCVAQEMTTAGDMPATSFAPFLSSGPGVANGILIDRGVTQGGGAGGGAQIFGPYHLDFKPAETLENVFVQNCRVSNVQGAATGLPLSGGVVMLGVDKGMIVDSHITGGNRDGILLGATGPSWINPFITIAATTNSIVEDNAVDNNANDGYFTPVDTNAFVANTAFRNGTNNYNIDGSASVGNIDIP